MLQHYRLLRRPMILTLCLLISGMTLWHGRPLRAQDPTAPLPKIESDDTHVTRTGTWQTQATHAASGGSYLYNSGEATLSLNFSGPSLEVIYLAGPSLGTLAIEVDGTVLRTVITTAESTAYQQSAKIDYLTDEAHELKVYAQGGGTVGIDTFVATLIAEAATEVSHLVPRVPDPDNMTHRVNLTSTNAQMTGGFGLSDISVSPDGRYVSFYTNAPLAPEDTNNRSDPYLRDRQTGTTERIYAYPPFPHVPPGPPHPPIQPPWIFFETEGDSHPTSGSEGHLQDSNWFLEEWRLFLIVTNQSLVPYDHGGNDTYLYDRMTGNSILVSASTNGTPSQGDHNFGNPVLSGNARYVVWSDSSSHLVPNDTNGRPDIFLRDLHTNTTSRVSVGTGGLQLNGYSNQPSISDDGRYVAFATNSNNIPPFDSHAWIFVHDRQTNTTEWVGMTSTGEISIGGMDYPQISPDGRYILSTGLSTNTVPDDTNGLMDIFLTDRETHTVRRISERTGGIQMTSGYDTGGAVISTDSRYVVFHSRAHDIAIGDTNGKNDLFIHDTWTGLVRPILITPDEAQTNDGAWSPALSADGRFVAYISTSTNLVADDTNGGADIFVSPLTPPADTLAFFNAGVQYIDLLYSHHDAPTHAYYQMNAPATGQWVMGDWNGDGVKTPGVYSNGTFWYTDVFNQSATWSGVWLGLIGRPPVVGRFDAGVNHDCIGAVDSANFPPYGTTFALYFTCDLTNNTAPPLTFQWLSVLLPDAGGFTGTHQFSAGDFNGDGVDSMTVRRGPFITFTNDAPTTLAANFPLAQYFGAPATSDEGTFVVGDWDGNDTDSFGLFYQAGHFYWRDDLDWNSGVYFDQQTGQPIGATGIQATSWH